MGKFPSGAWYAEDAKKIFAPPKEKILTSMEELIQNFMIVTEGPQIPSGEVYFEAENPKGALGFYIVSKGGGVPYRMKIRAPSFCNLSILEKLAPGHFSPISRLFSGVLILLWVSVIVSNMELSQALKKIDEVIPKYPEKRSAALMVIHLVQDEIGSISDETCSWIAEKLDLSLSILKNLSPFIDASGNPQRKKAHQGCRTLPCALGFI